MFTNTAECQYFPLISYFKSFTGTDIFGNPVYCAFSATAAIINGTHIKNIVTAIPVTKI
jgi:hypothetical protein